jgi:hypothetical protein
MKGDRLMFNAFKTGMAACGKWVLTHKKIVIGAIIGFVTIVGGAIGIGKKAQDPEALEAGEDAPALEADTGAETEAETTTSEEK